MTEEYTLVSSSHWDWMDDIIHKHNNEKPFAPENGQALRFAVGDEVIFTNDYGCKFKRTVIAIFSPDEDSVWYAQGLRYYLDKKPGSTWWVPVAESNLSLV